MKTKKAWGAGKAEVLALASEIQNLFVENQNLTTVFKILFEQKKITVGQRTFYRYASKIIKDGSFFAAANIKKTTSNNKNKVFEIIEPKFEHSNNLSEENMRKIWNQT